MLRLREIRTEKGVSVPALFRTTGMSVRTIQDIEKRGDCLLSNARILADALGVTLDELYPKEPTNE